MTIRAEVKPATSAAGSPADRVAEVSRSLLLWRCHVNVFAKTLSGAALALAVSHAWAAGAGGVENTTTIVP